MVTKKELVDFGWTVAACFLAIQLYKFWIGAI